MFEVVDNCLVLFVFVFLLLWRKVSQNQKTIEKKKQIKTKLKRTNQHNKPTQNTTQMNEAEEDDIFGINTSHATAPPPPTSVSTGSFFSFDDDPFSEKQQKKTNDIDQQSDPFLLPTSFSTPGMSSVSTNNNDNNATNDDWDDFLGLARPPSVAAPSASTKDPFLDFFESNSSPSPSPSPFLASETEGGKREATAADLFDLPSFKV